MRNLLLAAGLVLAPMLASAPALAQESPAGAYASDKTHTSVNWAMLHQGLSWYRARFTETVIHIDWNPADVAKSKVTATIDPKSVETDYARTRPAGNTVDFNAEVATRFLQADKHPTITFKSTAITKTGAKTGTMTGDLTFLGVTKPVTLDVTFNGENNRQKWKIGFSATGAFKRSDFGMTPGPLGDEIKLNIETELQLQ